MNLLLISIIVVFFLGIIGIDQFALADNTWYVGEGLQEGDYFKYSLCYVDYKSCAPVEMSFWVQNKTSDGNWNTLFVVSDRETSKKTIMMISSDSGEPISANPDFVEFADMYKNSVAWLSRFGIKDHPMNLTLPFGCYNCGKYGFPYPIKLAEEKISITAGYFDSWIIGWHRFTDHKIWIVDNFPFPVKALTYTYYDTPSVMYKFELLDYGNSLEPPWGNDNMKIEVKTTCSEDSTTTKEKVPVMIRFKDGLTDDEIRAKKTLQSVGRIDYKGEIELVKSYCGEITATPLLTNVIGANLPEDKMDALRKEPSVAHVIRDRITCHIENCDSFYIPRHQLVSGVSPKDVVCRSGLQLIFKSKDNSPACVKPETAQKLVERGWGSSTIQKMQKTWLEVEPVSCVNYKGLNACYIDWLADYYSSTKKAPNMLEDIAQFSLDHNSVYVRDYYGKEGVVISDVKFELISQGIGEFGESWDSYKLKVSVSDSDVEKMLDLGFKTSEKQNLMKTIKVTNTEFYMNYNITGGQVLTADFDSAQGTVMLSLLTTSDGEITTKFPRLQVDAKCISDTLDLFVLSDGKEISSEKIISPAERNLTFKFTNGTKEIEIIGQAMCGNMPSGASPFLK